MVEEARFEESAAGLAPVTDGWFVVNVRDAAWVTNETLGAACIFEADGERPLKAWDFVHCPPGTEHGFVGAGDGACVIFMTGGRTGEKRIVYPRSELALRHGAGVETETSSPAEAYAPFPKWQPGRPESWNGLPFA